MSAPDPLEAAARADERKKCARDVCMYCGQRAIGYAAATGPNEAGNYVHHPIGGGAPMLCRAAAILARDAFLLQVVTELVPEQGGGQ